MKKTRRLAYIIVSLILVCLLFVLAACGDTTGGGVVDGGKPDGGTVDGGKPDGGNPDGGKPDGGNPDGGNPDGGNPDGGNPDGGNPDGGNPDGGNPDDTTHECTVSTWNITESTCLVAGKMVGECTVCGETVTKELPLEDHVSEFIAAVAPTCSSTGLTEGEKCSVCGTILKAQVEVPINPDAHKPKTVPALAPTCTEPGHSSGMECELCGYATSATVTIPATGHTESVIPGVAATCTEDGLTYGKYCTVCNTTTLEQTVVPALNHAEAERAGVAPTCTETGLTPIIFCSRCKETLVSTQEIIPATGHTEKLISGKAASCSKSGKTDGKVCRDCGIVMRTQMTIPALGHDFSESHECGNNCGLTISIGIRYEESEDGTFYIVTGIGDFDGTVLVIPEEYQGKSVLEIAEGAFKDNETITSVIILDGVEVIGEGAFEGCSALKEVTVPASVTVVKSDAFNDCDLLVKINSASFEQMDLWDSDFFGNSEFQVASGVKGSLSPYQVYLEALSSLQRHIDNYTMYSENKSTLSQGGVEYVMMDVRQTVKNNGKNFYSHSVETDHMTTGSPQSYSTVYYINGRLYLSSSSQSPMSFNAGYEYIRSLSPGINNLVFDEPFFDDAIFYRNLDGTYYLKLVMNPNEMGDLMGDLVDDLVGQGAGAALSIQSAVYTYGFSQDGAIASCSSDVLISLSSVTMRVNNDMEFSNIGSTYISAPYGYTYYNRTPCTTHPEANIVEVPALEAGCLAQGNTAGSYCSRCLHDVVSSSIIEETGHKINNGVCEVCGYVQYSSPLAYELSTDQTYYTIIGLGGAAPDELVIPEHYNGLPVLYIAENAFKNNPLVKNVTIPASIRGIGKGAFEGCENLEKITVAYVGGSLDANRYLGYIFGASGTDQQGEYIPASLKTVIVRGNSAIADNAFFGCDKIETVSISQLVTSVSASAFGGCAGLKNVTVPTSAIPALKGLSIEVLYVVGGNAIGSEAFKDITSLRRVVIGRTVTEIGTDAFLGCINLIEVCNLSDLNITKGATSFGSIAYYAAVVSGEDTELTYSVDGNIYLNNSGTIYLVKYNGDGTKLILPESVNGSGYVVSDGIIDTDALEYVEICGNVSFENGNMFKDSAIKEIKIRGDYLEMFDLSAIETVTFAGGSIAQEAFYGSDTLKSVTIEDGVSFIGMSAFENCTALTTLNVGNVEYLTYRMCAGCTNLTTVNVSDEVGKFYEFVFEGCSKLESIDLPDALTAIPESAFKGCTSLKTIDLNNAESVGASAFNGCTALESIELGDVVSIYDSAFYNCDSLVTLAFPESTTHIGEEAFRECAKLESISFTAGSSATIGNYAFYYCPELKTIDLADVTTIGNSAFQNCAKITAITVPSSVTSIGKSAFSGCSAAQTLVIENGVGAIADAAFSSLRSITVLVLPASIRSLGKEAFSSCDQLESVSFNSGLVSIGDFAFALCPKIKGLDLPATLQTIGKCAFQNVSLVDTLVIPSGVTSIGNGAFMSSTSLGELTVSRAEFVLCFDTSSLKKLNIYGNGSITATSLSGATALEELFIAPSISSIEKGALSSLTSLKSLTVPFMGTSKTDNNAAYLGNLFGASSSSQHASYVPASLTYFKLDGTATLHANSLQNCSSLKTIVISSSVVGIGKNAFTTCTGLEELTVPFLGDGGTNAKLSYVCSTNGKLKKVTVTDGYSVIDYAFSGVSSLEEIVILSNVSSIGSYAFSDLKNLKSVSLPSNVTSLGINAFKGCSALVEITLPSGVKEIPDYCFYACTSLKTVNTQSEIKTIGAYAFRECFSLESFDFGNELISIGNNAFYQCTALLYAYLPDSLQTLGSYSFASCTRLLAVKFGSGLTTIGSYSFNSCPSLVVVYNYSTLPVKLNSSSYGSIPNSVLDLITDKTVPERIETDENGLIFYYNGEIAHLIGYSGSNSNVELPEYYKGLSYDIYSNAFRNNKVISSISIPATVSTIGSNAFYCATSLSTVTGGEGITSIGSSAFTSTPWIANATETIYLGTILIKFADTINSSSNVTIPEGTTTIYENAFANLGVVESVTVPASVTSIASNAFTGFIARNVYAPAEVINNVLSSGTKYAFVSSGEKIPSKAFSKCKYSLLGVTLPETLTSIGTNAFQDCFKLVEIWNYSSLTLALGSTTHGYIAYYAQAIYTSPEEKSKIQQIGDYTFYVSDTSNILIGYTGMATDITLPTLEGGKTYEVGAYSFSGSALTSVVIPDCVTKIGYGAFSDSKTLASATLGTGITDIPDYAFSNTALNSITINGTLTGIGKYAFQATKLTSFNVPGTVKRIDQYAFYNVTSLNTLTLGEGVERIEKSAFLRTSIAELVIPSTVRFIGSSAFSNISTLTSVTCNSTDIEIEVYAGYSSSGYTGINPFDSTPWYTNQPDGYVRFGNTLISYKGTIPENTSLVIPTGITRVSAYAFYNQMGIVSVVIPDSVESVGASAFSGCKNVKEITGPAEFMSRNVFSISTNNGMTHIVKVTITSGKAITNGALEGASSLESLEIADSVETIGERAFYNCDKLTTVVLPANLKEIGKTAFSSCNELASVTFKNGITTIGDYAFSYCEKLTSITIPASVKSIGQEAFRQCSALSYVKVEGEDTTFGADPFRDCKALSEVYLPASQLSAVPSVYNYTSTITLYITSGTTIKARALSGRTSIEKVVMCDTITTIEDEAFYACYSLKSISFSKKLETIGASAFSAGTGSGNKTTLIETLEFPDSLRSIGRFAFYGSTKLTSVKFNEGLASIGEYAFSNCPLLTSVTLPDSVFWVDKPNESEYAFDETVKTVVAPAYAYQLFKCRYLVNVTVTKGDIAANTFASFDNNSPLVSVTLKEGVTSIGEQAFCRAKITSIVIPSTVKTIGRCAFYGCSSLTSVTLNEGLEMIDKEAFIFCNLKSIVLPSTLTCVMSNAFESNFAGYVEYNGGYYLGTKDNPYFLLMRETDTFTEAHPDNKLVASIPVYN